MPSRKSSILIIMLTVALTFVSCNRKTVYDRFQAIDISGWHRGDTLFYSVEPVEMSGRYTAQLSVRTNDDYPYHALTLIVEQRVMSDIKSKKSASTTVVCSFLSEERVSWKNESTSSERRRAVDSLPQSVDVKLFLDTVQIQMNGRDARMMSRGMTYYSYTVPLRCFDLHASDSLSIALRHYMSCEMLPGISDIGIRIDTE